MKIFSKDIPKEIRTDINYTIERSGEDSKERSVTFCKLPNRTKLHTSSYAKGNVNFTEINPCSARFGQAQRIADFHTHVDADNKIGITPSEPDFTINLVNSHNEGVKQISCISNSASKFIHCFQPKKFVEPDRLQKYDKALSKTMETGITDPFFRTAIGEDFNHSWFDRQKYNRVSKPNAEAVVKDAIGSSVFRYRALDVEELEKSAFCNLIADYSFNKEDELNNKVAESCRNYLKQRKTLLNFTNL